MPALRAFWDAALAVAPERAGSVDDRHRVGYPSAGPLSAVLSQAGLVNVDTGEITVTAAYEDFDDLWWPFTTGTGHSGACPGVAKEPMSRSGYARTLVGASTFRTGRSR